MRTALLIVFQILVTNSTALVHLYDEEDFKFFLSKNEDNLSTIYLLFKDGNVKNFDESYHHIFDKYGIERATYDCDGLGESIPQCKEADGSMVLSLFKNKDFLLNLKMEYMFDEVSIESNILQVLLITEVPIHTDLNERFDMIRAENLPQIFIYGYFEELGIKVHLHFMKLAFKYRHLYKFGFAIYLSACQKLHRSTTLSEGDSALWVLKCTENVDDCISYRYDVDDLSDESFDKMLDKFVENNLMVIDHTIAQSEVDLFENNFMHFAVVCYETKASERAINFIRQIAHAFKGILGFILIDVGRMEAFSSLCDNYGDNGSIKVHVDGGNPLKISNMLLKDEFQIVEEIWMLINRSPKENVIYKDESDSNTDDSDSKVLIQDDEVALIADNFEIDLKKFPLVLTGNTHMEFMKRTDNRMILYYLPFDPVSKIFLISYKDAARELLQEDLNVLALINCFDYTYVCKEQNITKYPTIIIHKEDGSKIFYNKSLSSDSVISTMKMINFKFPIFLETVLQVNDFIHGYLPYRNMHSVSNFTVLAVFQSWNDGILSHFKKQPNPNVPSGYVVGLNVDFLNIALPEEPCLVIYHRLMNTVKTSLVTLKEASDIKNIISSYSETPLVQLSAFNFHEKFSLKKPFVTLFESNINPSSPVYHVLSSISSSGDDISTQYIFSYMDIKNPNGIERKIFLEYESEENLPALIYINHSDKEVFIFPHDVEKNGKNVIQWLNSIDNTESIHRLKENNWTPPTLGFNFMKILYPDRSLGADIDVSTYNEAHNVNIPYSVRANFNDDRYSTLYKEKVEL